ncbi:MAG: thiamine pyrophosphate-binding protein [Thaumarchaeota archaeon]|nr:thiamine pyrophosphate-binding protein [Nitrososphaerota archaeon]
MRVVDAVAQYLVNEGVEHYFGYIGATVWPLLDALIEKPQLKGIQPKHEAAAVQMADAYYRLKHKVAPVIVTKGPGVLNTVCAVTNAMHDSSAVVLIAGAGPTQYFDKGGYEEVYYHQSEDTTSVFRPIVKRAWLVVRPENTLDVLSRALKTATTGRPGPVLVQLPWDIQLSEFAFDVPDPNWLKPVRRTRGDSREIEKAAQLLLSAQRPLIVVGGGAMTSEALPEILLLTARYRIPIVTSLMAKGAVSDNDPLSLGQIGRAGSGAANQSAKEADVILGIGCRFTDWETINWRQNVVFGIPPSKLIQIDIDESEIGRNYQVEVGIVGDAKASLEDLLKSMEQISQREKEEQRKRVSDWVQSVTQRKADWEKTLSKDLLSDVMPMHPARLLYEIRKAVPDDTLFFNDIGEMIQNGQGYLKIVEPKSWYINGGMFQMGWGGVAVLTGKLLYPNRPCIALIGDGAFLMINYALATAVENDLAAIWIIFNNYGPNLERKAELDLYHRAHPWGSFSKKGGGSDTLYNPDFVKMAESYGAKGTHAKTPAEVSEAVRRAIGAKAPYVIEVPTNRDVPTFFAPGLNRAYPSSWTDLAPHL